MSTESAAPDGPPPVPTGVLGDSAAQSVSLESNASAVNYHAWLTDMARPYLGDDPVELGSGLGDYARRWLEGGAPRITVSELDPERLTVLRDVFEGDARVTVRQLDAEQLPAGQYSSCVAFNVLEHITQDVATLRSMRTLVRPGGYVVMFVPAFEFAMSDFDRLVGHVRRYRKSGLVKAFTSAGLVVEDARYVNLPGLLAWFVGMRLLRMTPGDGLILRVWDKMVIPLTRALERHVRAPFGQSVLVVGRVPE